MPTHGTSTGTQLRGSDTPLPASASSKETALEQRKRMPGEPGPADADGSSAKSWASIWRGENPAMSIAPRGHTVRQTPHPVQSLLSSRMRPSSADSAL